MQFDCILPTLILPFALLSDSVCGIQRKDFAVDADNFWITKNVSCPVVGEGFDENPDKCQAFNYPRDRHEEYSNLDRNLRCCETAEPNSELPESLKGIVKVDNDWV